MISIDFFLSFFRKTTEKIQKQINFNSNSKSNSIDIDSIRKEILILQRMFSNATFQTSSPTVTSASSSSSSSFAPPPPPPPNRPLPTIQQPIQRSGFAVSIRELTDGRKSLRKVSLKTGNNNNSPSRLKQQKNQVLFTPMTLKSTSTIIRSPGGTPLRTPLAQRINHD